MSRSNFLDFLSRGWSRLRLSHEVEHSKSRQEERSSEHMACMPDCIGHVSCYLMCFIVSRSQTPYHPLPATRVEERVWNAIDSAVLVQPESWWR